MTFLVERSREIPLRRVPMRVRSAKLCSLFVVAALWVSPALGQITQGRLTGIVTDAQGAVLPGVTVTVTSPALIGTRIAVPNSTDVWGALSEAPGVRMQGFDVGGSHKSQQSGYEVFGVQNQARVVSDGVDHTEGVGGTGFYEDYYANEEVSGGALGRDVEMNSPGAPIFTVIKSGGNSFKGLEHFSYEPGKFVGDNAAPKDVAARGYLCPAN